MDGWLRLSHYEVINISTYIDLSVYILTLVQYYHTEPMKQQRRVSLRHVRKKVTVNLPTATR